MTNTKTYSDQMQATLPTLQPMTQHDYTASLPELLLALSVIANDLRLKCVVEVLDRGATSGIIRFVVIPFDTQPNARVIRAFRAIMTENCIPVLECACEDGAMYVNLTRRT